MKSTRFAEANGTLSGGPAPEYGTADDVVDLPVHRDGRRFTSHPAEVAAPTSMLESVLGPLDGPELDGPAAHFTTADMSAIVSDETEAEVAAPPGQPSAEAQLIALMQETCEELGLEEENGEHCPILEALNQAHNIGAQRCASGFAKAGLLKEQAPPGEQWETLLAAARGVERAHTHVARGMTRQEAEWTAIGLLMQALEKFPSPCQAAPPKGTP